MITIAKRLVILAIVCFAGVAALAEDWHTGATGIQYDCDVYGQIQLASQSNDEILMSNLMAQPLVRTSNDDIAASDYLGTLKAEAASRRQEALLDIVEVACNPESAANMRVTLFNIKLNADANLRACAGTDCDVVSTAKLGDMFDVVGANDEWFEVKTPDGTAYVAQFLSFKVMCQ